MDHNTVLQSGNSVLYGDTNPVQRFTMTNNIVPGQRVGHHGRRHLAGQRHDCHLLPERDVPAGCLGGMCRYYLPDRQLLPGEHGRRRLRQPGRRRLPPVRRSLYRNAALDGTDVGANIDTILAATAGVK